MQALLGAMEQQEVAVAKAGMCATLPARTTVIAAANPAGGSWLPSKTIRENLKLSPGLLSRFDLVFVLVDAPDRQHDAQLSTDLLAKHAGVCGSLEAAPACFVLGRGALWLHSACESALSMQDLCAALRRCNGADHGFMPMTRMVRPVN